LFHKNLNLFIGFFIWTTKVRKNCETKKPYNQNICLSEKKLFIKIFLLSKYNLCSVNEIDII